MSVIPIPPSAYWGNIPWPAFLLLCCFVAVLASPFAVQWLRGRANSSVSREADLTQRERALSASLSADRDAARASLAHERAAWAQERDEMEADRDMGWDLGRGMEELARDQRNNFCSLVSRFNTLLGMFRDLAAGGITKERAVEVSATMKPAVEPRPLPLLKDVGRKKP